MSDQMSGTETNPPPVDRSRALVFVERRRGARSAVQAPADFLAQLIACEKRLGEYRSSRREAPALGVARYRPRDTSLTHDLDVRV